jgi:hypothetical protein
VTQHQGVLPEQSSLAPQQPVALSCRQPENASAGWLPRTAPGAPQPVSGWSPLGWPPVAACNFATDQPQPAAVAHIPRAVVKPPSEAAPRGQPAALPPAAVRLTAPVSNMCLETYCQIHSLLTGGEATVVQQLHASQCSTIRSQDIKQVHHMDSHAWSASRLPDTCMQINETVCKHPHYCALFQVLYMHGHAVGSKTKQVQPTCVEHCMRDPCVRSMCCSMCAYGCNAP